jgi:sulfopropanediol 3-dehydrogenase
VPAKLRDDIRFAHRNISRFAEAQRATIMDCTIEILPGLMAGQKQIPVSSAGCYVPGGRYSHIASAIMTITTAKAAGVPHITACSPPRPGMGIPPAIIFAMDLCGADVILNLGGVQGVAAMANGLFGLPKADILVGPGNQYVAEAKRILYGQVGIDMFAGPDRQHGDRRWHRRCRSGGLGFGGPGRTRLQLAGLAGDDRPRAGRSGDGAGARADRQLPR